MQRLQSSDNVYATATNIPASGSTVVLNVSGFNFSIIPNDATIGGIVVNVEGNSQSNRVRASLVQLTQGTTLIGTNQANASTFTNNTDNVVS